MNVLQSCFSKTPSICVLSDQVRLKLEKVSEQRHYRRRQVIHFSDQSADFIYLLCSGRVKVSRVSDMGREVTLYIIEPFQLFGESSLLDKEALYGVMAETLDDSHVIVIRKADFLDAFQNSPQASFELMRTHNKRLLTVENKVADLVFLDVTRRLAKLLINLHDGNEKNHNGLISEKFTHQELANLVGSTRETTTLILNDFRRRGMIDFLGRKIIIRSHGDLGALFQ